MTTIRPISFPLRVCTFVKESLQSLYSLFARYCGSKSRAGYHFGFERMIAKEEAASYLPIAAASAYAFNGKADQYIRPLGWNPIQPQELQITETALQRTPSALYDKTTGLKIALAEKNEEVLIAISGLVCSQGNEKSEKASNWRDGISRDPAKLTNLLGAVPTVFTQAEQVIAKLAALPRLRNKKITLVGQCFGGALASYTALRLGMKAVCLNSLQLGAGVQAKIGDEKLKNSAALITHLCVDGDWLTTGKATSLFDRFLSFLGIRTPGNFGKKYFLPSAYQSTFDSHGFFLGSLMAHMGYDKRTLPVNLPPFCRNR